MGRLRRRARRTNHGTRTPRGPLDAFLHERVSSLAIRAIDCASGSDVILVGTSSCAAWAVNLHPNPNRRAWWSRATRAACVTRVGTAPPRRVFHGVRERGGVRAGRDARRDARRWSRIRGVGNRGDARPPSTERRTTSPSPEPKVRSRCSTNARWRFCTRRARGDRASRISSTVPTARVWRRRRARARRRSSPSPRRRRDAARTEPSRGSRDTAPPCDTWTGPRTRPRSPRTARITNCCIGTRRRRLTTEAPRDARWAEWTRALGFPVMGVWAPESDGTDVNATHADPDGRLLVTADDRGEVKLFAFPCVVEGAGFKSYRGHASFVECADSRLDGERVVTAGGRDGCAFQYRGGARRAGPRHAAAADATVVAPGRVGEELRIQRPGSGTRAGGTRGETGGGFHGRGKQIGDFDDGSYIRAGGGSGRGRGRPRRRWRRFRVTRWRRRSAARAPSPRVESTRNRSSRSSHRPRRRRRTTHTEYPRRVLPCRRRARATTCCVSYRTRRALRLVVHLQSPRRTSGDASVVFSVFRRRTSSISRRAPVPHPRKRLPSSSSPFPLARRLAVEFARERSVEAPTASPPTHSPASSTRCGAGPSRRRRARAPPGDARADGCSNVTDARAAATYRKASWTV